ncbi:hypothetical protein CHH61_03985 [Shouchella clausii]|jgi:LysM repeat protein|uniref:LysM domain-containing protein n=1 Tax=Shouchella clausii TaxID=79880 RepID=A0A268S5T6_SHOCL|nr:LysM domain-containing protein [Shouchella clausii]PAF27296.1 hypothetical protein CHH61_03985 [Shouchella clausii]
MGFKRGKRRANSVSQTGLVEEQVDQLGFRLLSAVSIVAVVGTLLFFVFFFSSDVRGKIIAAKSASAYAAQLNTPDSALDSPDVGQVVSEDTNTQRMSDEDSQTTEEKVREGLNDTIEERIDNPEQIPETRDSFQTTIEDAYAKAEQLYPGQIDGSKRLKLVNDLNAIDYMYYVAEEGDTLIKLSRSFGVPLGQLVELNGIHDADVLPAGMILLFPLETEPLDIDPDEN